MIIKTLPKALSFALSAKEKVKGATKKGFWQEVADIIKEGGSVVVAYHVGYPDIVRSGVRLPLGIRESRKGGGIFFGQHPILSLAQRGILEYENPFTSGKRGLKYFRSILSPKRMYEVDESALEEAFQKFAAYRNQTLAEAIWNHATRAVGDLMKLVGADKMLAFPSKGAVEYVVKDPSIIKYMGMPTRRFPHHFFPENPKLSPEEIARPFSSYPYYVDEEEAKRLVATAVNTLRKIIRRPKEQFLEVARYPHDLPPEFVAASSEKREAYRATAGKIHDLVSMLLEMGD